MHLRYLLLILCGAILFSCALENTAYDQTSDTTNDDPVENKIDSLLSLMTLKEKVGQLVQYSVGEELTGPGEKTGKNKTRLQQLHNGEVGSVLNLLGAENTRRLQEQVMEKSRLKIPVLFAYDVIHGYKTMFPVPLGESASWDLEYIRKAAAVAADESSAAGLHWTFAPMVDVGRDPRWGRVMEGAGEDSYLGAEIAKARVMGLQGEDLAAYNTIAACAKHFAGYGFVEGGKDYNNVNVGMSTLMNTIIPPFKAAEEAGAATFMNAFNDIDGIPSTANDFLLQDLLKDQWGFEGFVVSDWNSIGEMVAHGTVGDNAEAAQMAINAGTDMDMEADAYNIYLTQLVEDGKVDIKAVDDAVRRVLRVKYRLGLFDDPFKYHDTEREKSATMSKENLQMAREVAKRSVVLLKNEKSILPLDSDKKSTIAVIGPLAKDKDTPLGNWRAAAEKNSAVSLYEGLENAMGENISLTYAKGCELSVGENNFFNELTIEDKDRSMFRKAIRTAKRADVVVMALGEPAYMSGEARSRSEIGLPGMQLELLKEIRKVNDNVVLVLMNGRPLTIQWEAENIPAIVEAWHLGSEAGNAIADVLTGKYNPSGKLPMSFPKSVGQIPVFYNHKATGRPSTDPGMVFYTHYMDVDNRALFPFGYGLSYSTFDYSNLRLNNSEMKADGSIKVSIDIKNSSDRDGEEVVQLYLRDLVSSVTRPVKELKKFRKLMIKAGDIKTVEFELSNEDLAFYRKDLSFGSEPGRFKVFIGGNSADLLESEFTLVK